MRARRQLGALPPDAPVEALEDGKPEVEARVDREDRDVDDVSERVALESMVVPSVQSHPARGRMTAARPRSVGSESVLPGSLAVVLEAGPPGALAEAETFFELTDPVIVSDVIEQLCGRAPHVALHQSASVAEAKILQGSADGLFIEMADSPSWAGGKIAVLRAQLHDVVFLVEGLLDHLAFSWVLRAPLHLYCVNRRAAARVTLPPAAGTLRFCLRDSSAPAPRDASVCDLGVDGIGVELSDGGFLAVDEQFPAVLRIDEAAVPCLASVRHHELRGGVARMGLLLHTADREALVGGYLRRRFPRLIERSTVDRKTLLDLLEQSGYLDLRTGTEPPERWFSLPETKGLSRDICYRTADGAIIGHISATRAYSRAWLGHQIATLKGHPETLACRREIYLHIAAFATSMDGEDTVMYGYFDRSKKWHQIFFHDFVRWVNDPSLAVIADLDRFERAHPGPVERASVRGDGVEIAEPEPEESVIATALIRAQLPPLVADTLDITPDRLASSCLHPEYRNGPYRRERHVLALRIRGKLSGVALCEVGSRELTLFNLFNTAFFFFVTGPGAPPAAAQLCLLDQVRALYAEHGEHNPLIVAPPGTFQATSEPGTILAETMGLIAKSGRSLRQYECFIKYRFGNYSEHRS